MTRGRTWHLHYNIKWCYLCKKAVFCGKTDGATYKDSTWQLSIYFNPLPENQDLCILKDNMTE